MKNKIRVLTGMLIMILLLTAGCGKKETLAFDEVQSDITSDYGL